MNQIIVIHHSADFDGIFSREIARKFFDDRADYLGWDYGDPVPAIHPSVAEIYMIDISIDALMGDTRLIWIDHHKSAIEKYPAQIRGYRIDGVAACRLAWQWFFTYNNQRNPIADTFAELPDKADFVDRNVLEPLSVRLAGEYDIWDKRDPRAELFQHGLRSRDLETLWISLLSIHKPSITECEEAAESGVKLEIEPDGTIVPIVVSTLLEGGYAVQYAKTKENASIIKHLGFTVHWEGLCFLACNHASFNSHLFTAGIKPEHDALLGFKFNGFVWKVSLYGVPGKPDIDLAKIAVKHGGGGHKQACGFEVQSYLEGFIPFSAKL